MAAPPARERHRRLTTSAAASRVARSEWRTAVLVCVVAGAVRLAIAALTPLFPDETYYWEWSRNLAAGYFDHPPMIAWVTAVGRAVFGDTPLGVRAPSVLLGAAAAILVAATARRLAGDRAALWTASIFALMPLAAAGLLLATPDAPLLAAVAAVFYATVRVLEHGSRTRASLVWWCVAGIALGVAFMSKYTSALLPGAMLVALATNAGLRERLRGPGPYGGVAVAVLLFAPVIVWNARHDWISFTFQLRHGLSGASGSIVGRELELVGGQAALVSPVLFVLCTVSVARGLKTSAPPLHRLLAAAATVLFAFFMYSATRRRVEANWPALAYVPAVLLLVAAPAAARRREVWLRIGVGIAAVMTAVVYVNAFVPVLPVPAPRDPAARAAGWDALARAVTLAMPAGAPRAYVAADRYQDASELAFHLPSHPRTFSLNLDGRPNQYDLWPRFRHVARRGDDLLLVLVDTPGAPAQITMLAPHFASITRGDSARLERDGDLVRQYRVWQLRGWRGTWPQAELRSRS